VLATVIQWYAWTQNLLCSSLQICLILRFVLYEICHWDLKLENTLLDRNPSPRLKICDFRYSKVNIISLIWTFMEIYYIMISYTISKVDSICLLTFSGLVHTYVDKILTSISLLFVDNVWSFNCWHDVFIIELGRKSTCNPTEEALENSKTCRIQMVMSLISSETS